MVAKNIITVAIMVLALSSGAALADSQTGSLGAPDRVVSNSGTWSLVFVVPTTPCTDFAPGDSLTFTAVSYHSLTKYWGDWIQRKTHFSGSTVAGTSTYTARGNVELFSHASAENLGEGKLVVRRDDGTTITGHADIGFSGILVPPSGAYVALWHETRCR